MVNYSKYLSNIYPGNNYYKLLPRGEPTKVIDLTRYNLECLGLIGSGLSKVYAVKQADGKVKACKITRIERSSKHPAEIAYNAKNEILIGKKIAGMSYKKHTCHNIMPITAFAPTIKEIDEYIKNAEKPRLGGSQPFEIITVSDIALPYDLFFNRVLSTKIRSLSQKEAAAICLDIVYALKALQDFGVNHRDIKIQNLLLVRRRGKTFAAFSDYNISRKFEENQKTFSDYTICSCTPSCSHPFQQKILSEQSAATIKISVENAEKLDAYRLGILLYKIFNNGEAPRNLSAKRLPQNAPEPIGKIIYSLLKRNYQQIPSINSIIKLLENLIK